MVKICVRLSFFVSPSQKLSTLNSQLSTIFITFAPGNRKEGAKYALPLPFTRFKPF